jgi:hypothetical protein
VKQLIQVIEIVIDISIGIMIGYIIFGRK